MNGLPTTLCTYKSTNMPSHISAFSPLTVSIFVRKIILINGVSLNSRGVVTCTIRLVYSLYSNKYSFEILVYAHEYSQHTHAKCKRTKQIFWDVYASEPMSPIMISQTIDYHAGYKRLALKMIAYRQYKIHSEYSTPRNDFSPHQSHCLVYPTG